MFHVKPLKARPLAEDWQQGGFGLYIHWPFCQSKCPYCDFNSHVAAKIDQARWRDAYLREIDRAAAETPGRILQTVFFGGGTPSLLAPEIVDAIIAKVRAAWPTANDIEITMEANPGSVEAGRFAAYRQAGVNRVSIGVQALNDTDLKALGRLHSVADSLAAIKIAQKTFDRTSFDLIYARQGQSLAAWQAELDQALQIANGHLSLYQLTIEDGTAFGDRFRRGLLKGLPDEDLGADMYLATQDATNAAGYKSYEVSNYAKDSQESRHNCIYWNAGDYIGIGPGAHGRLSLDGCRWSTEATSNPTAWLESIEAGAPKERRDLLSSAEQGTEYLMMGLRRDIGIDLERYSRLAKSTLNRTTVADLESLGLVVRRENRLSATPSGRLVLNAVIEKLMAE
ncbi:coproporphyrinogen III oxidase [Pseudorhodobacter sp. E13]|uniref:radical SAM family heme chaperone HemW n=1 Tax=Pseudorhodobacter sp. E13 TaxID=2487931 RepID=UPI000F8DD132|nr:radical SAM family heme chaperone HemW [Pseudorhodobacter sp. E13]RUS59583.1 coproporphyrinogen III oxidase [Pseudorhodobacter sp. E13]